MHAVNLINILYSLTLHYFKLSSRFNTCFQLSLLYLYSKLSFHLPSYITAMYVTEQEKNGICNSDRSKTFQLQQQSQTNHLQWQICTTAICFMTCFLSISEVLPTLQYHTLYCYIARRRRSLLIFPALCTNHSFLFLLHNRFKPNLFVCHVHLCTRKMIVLFSSHLNDVYIWT